MQVSGVEKADSEAMGSVKHLLVEEVQHQAEVGIQGHGIYYSTGCPGSQSLTCNKR